MQIACVASEKREGSAAAESGRTSSVRPKPASVCAVGMQLPPALQKRLLRQGQAAGLAPGVWVGSLFPWAPARGRCPGRVAAPPSPCPCSSAEDTCGLAWAAATGKDGPEEESEAGGLAPAGGVRLLRAHRGGRLSWDSPLERGCLCT